MLKKQILLSITGLSILSLSSPSFAMENSNLQEKKVDTTKEKSDKLEMLKLLLANGATITEYDLHYAQKHDPEIFELFKSAQEERRKKKEQEEKERKRKRVKK